jgi:hypothetical protein
MKIGERKENIKELMQLFGVLCILLFVRIIPLNWFGNVNRLDSFVYTFICQNNSVELVWSL